MAFVGFLEKTCRQPSLRTAPWNRSNLTIGGHQKWSSSTPASRDLKMFDKVLIANRGEIACRVMRTAKRLGIKTVAVYSEADKNALHVKMADESHCIGPAPSSQSYLLQEKIINVAKTSGAQAIHPGYGFLSENKDFSNLCAISGLEFIGPPATAIEQMGIKRVSKQIMSASDVPVVPGYYGDDQSSQKLKMEADKLGYPVLLKADLGGGGKGMRIVHDPKDFDSLLESCKSESKAAFGDDKVLVEKFVDTPRHVEVQVFADKEGNTIHLFERDCSVQRRHQKIIEEAPAPGLRPDVRERICTAAVKAAKAVGYVGAGTVEFILDADQNFYFMEMNTRLQVEHPITEMITGVDLVEWQLKVAAGYSLPVEQRDLQARGHAFEARIYAENPHQDFTPSPGTLVYLNPPVPSEVVRIDTGVMQGDVVSHFYDPMIAKLVVWSEDRTSALKRLTSALHSYQIAGLETNVDFLGKLASHPSFISGDVHTGFIPQHKEDLFAKPVPMTTQGIALGCAALLAWENYQYSLMRAFEKDPYSPFNCNSGKRLNAESLRRIQLKCREEDVTLEVSYMDENTFVIQKLHRAGDSQAVEILDMPVSGKLVFENGRLCLTTHLGNSYTTSNIAIIDRTIHIFSELGNYQISIPAPHFYKARRQEGGGTRSPVYPSVVLKVFVKPGEKVEKGNPLVTLSGMKMETTIVAPADSIIKEVLFSDGDNVPPRSRLVVLEEEDT